MRTRIMVASVVASAMQPAQLSAADTPFCTRLAAEAGIDVGADAEKAGSWSASALNFGQRFLFGGSSTIAIGVHPAEPETVEDYKRLAEACNTTQRGAICQLEGAAVFTLVWKGRELNLPIEEGERAVVEIRNSRLSCRLDASAV